jgi:iron-sulfur cluster repair protein YtfE (RIC family)
MFTVAPTSPAAGSPYAPTFPPQRTSTVDDSGPDLTIFLLAHRVFRREFDRLGEAAAVIGAEEAPLTYAIEDQIAMMARSLHAHHHGEDTEIWPVVRERDPAGAVVLDALEQEHTKIDPLISIVTDTSIPLRHRAVVLHELSDLLNAHLDREEAEALPLIRRHFTAAEWEADGKAHTKKLRKDLPAFVCTMIDHMTPDEVAQLMADGPKILVVLYKLSWRRMWARRRPLIDGL